ncbi:MAG: PEP-CTERM sorting domain-containing protein [Akkermansia sp.]|nr:PEP-CTERM sorting domain-containing protein [Akkermansia sp.]
MKRTLFILALSTFAAIPHTFAATGDTVVSNSSATYVAEGMTVTGIGTGYAAINRTQSTRFYDSNKGGPWTTPYSDGTEGDSLMCWSHATSNSLQYWQDVYGVFYRDSGNMAEIGSNEPRELPNGYYATESITDYNGEVVNGEYPKVEVPNAKQLNIAKDFYNNWENSGGKFGPAADWYFKWDSTTSTSPGGYYSEYFGNGNDSRSSFVTIYSQHIEDMDPYVQGTSAGHSAFANNDLNGLKEALLPGFGLEKQANGSYVQTNEGILPFIGIWYDTTDSSGETLSYGHMLTAYGFTLNADGSLKSILIGNGDDNVARAQELFLKINSDGKIQLYRNSACTTPFIAGCNYYIGEVSYINTPEVLQNMLTEYRSLDEAAVWNGGATEWSTQVDVVDSEIADSSTGWDILVDGANIDEKHHAYYHGYALEGRNVEFGEHADANNRTVTVTGTVHARNITVSAAGYEFKAGEDAAIAGAGEGEKANLTITSGASLSSEVQLNLGDLTLENGAVLSSDKVIEVHGAFLVKLQEAATFGLARAAVTPEASVHADLDLRDATSITLNAEVNMNDHNLILSADTPITLSLNEVDGSIMFFTNIKQLSIVDGEVTTVVAEGANLTQYFSNITTADGRDLSGYQVIYSSGTLSMTLVPEPTTATLSLLALAALAARRRRK